jgi:hypothetical protein
MRLFLSLALLVAVCWGGMPGAFAQQDKGKVVSWRCFAGNPTPKCDVQGNVRVCTWRKALCVWMVEFATTPRYSFMLPPPAITPGKNWDCSPAKFVDQRDNKFFLYSANRCDIITK